MGTLPHYYPTPFLRTVCYTSLTWEWVAHNWENLVIWSSWTSWVMMRMWVLHHSNEPHVESQPLDLNNKSSLFCVLFFFVAIIALYWAREPQKKHVMKNYLYFYPQIYLKIDKFKKKKKLPSRSWTNSQFILKSRANQN